MSTIDAPGSLTVVSFRAPLLTPCPHCGGTDTVRHPSPLWRWALLPAWALIAATCMGGSLIGPGIIPLLPFLFGWAVCLLSGLYARAYDPPTCDACEKMVTNTLGHEIRPSDARSLVATHGAP